MGHILKSPGVEDQTAAAPLPLSAGSIQEVYTSVSFCSFFPSRSIGSQEEGREYHGDNMYSVLRGLGRQDQSRHRVERML